MTNDQRQKVFEALLGRFPENINDRAIREMNEITTEDVYAIEPVIDEIIQEERRKYFDLLLHVLSYAKLAENEVRKNG
jgi:hypothetical protein